MTGNKNAKKFWLRDEVKAHEKRTPLTPENAKKLLDLGYEIHVERSTTRSVKDSAYESIGCKMEKAGSWINAPLDFTILGLKELPEDTYVLNHRHIYFAHCFKNQTGWRELLQRHAGDSSPAAAAHQKKRTHPDNENEKEKEKGGILYDLEFLVDEQGRRVCAFGRAAGFVGAAFGIVGWCERQYQGIKHDAVDSHESEAHLVSFVKSKLQAAMTANGGKAPKVIVIGALGRCGKGAVDLCEKVGVEVTKWDMNETKNGGPFKEVLDHDVFVNAIYLQPGTKMPPFLSIDFLNQHPERKLLILSDVSCDYNNPSNPVPIYKQSTTYEQPFISVEGLTPSTPVLDVLSIDNLPSALPFESSIDFSNDLIPHLSYYGDNTGVWPRAEKTFRDKVALLSNN